MKLQLLLKKSSEEASSTTSPVSSASQRSQRNSVDSSCSADTTDFLRKTSEKSVITSKKITEINTISIPDYEVSDDITSTTTLTEIPESTVIDSGAENLIVEKGLSEEAILMSSKNKEDAQTDYYKNSYRNVYYNQRREEASNSITQPISARYETISPPTEAPMSLSNEVCLTEQAASNQRTNLDYKYLSKVQQYKKYYGQPPMDLRIEEPFQSDKECQIIEERFNSSIIPLKKPSKSLATENELLNYQQMSSSAGYYASKSCDRDNSARPLNLSQPKTSPRNQLEKDACQNFPNLNSALQVPKQKQQVRYPMASTAQPPTYGNQNYQHYNRNQQQQQQHQQQQQYNVSNGKSAFAIPSQYPVHAQHAQAKLSEPNRSDNLMAQENLLKRGNLISPHQMINDQQVQESQFAFNPFNPLPKHFNLLTPKDQHAILQQQYNKASNNYLNQSRTQQINYPQPRRSALINYNVSKNMANNEQINQANWLMASDKQTNQPQQQLQTNYSVIQQRYLEQQKAKESLDLMHEQYVQQQQQLMTRQINSILPTDISPPKRPGRPPKNKPMTQPVMPQYRSQQEYNQIVLNYHLKEQQRYMNSKQFQQLNPNDSNQMNNQIILSKSQPAIVTTTTYSTFAQNAGAFNSSATIENPYKTDKNYSMQRLQAMTTQSNARDQTQSKKPNNAIIDLIIDQVMSQSQPKAKPRENLYVDITPIENDYNRQHQELLKQNNIPTKSALMKPMLVQPHKLLQMKPIPSYPTISTRKSLTNVQQPLIVSPPSVLQAPPRRPPPSPQLQIQPSLQQIQQTQLQQSLQTEKLQQINQTKIYTNNNTPFSRPNERLSVAEISSLNGQLLFGRQPELRNQQQAVEAQRKIVDRFPIVAHMNSGSSLYKQNLSLENIHQQTNNKHLTGLNEAKNLSYAVTKDNLKTSENNLPTQTRSLTLEELLTKNKPPEIGSPKSFSISNPSQLFQQRTHPSPLEIESQTLLPQSISLPTGISSPSSTTPALKSSSNALSSAATITLTTTTLTPTTSEASRKVAAIHRPLLDSFAKQSNSHFHQNIQHTVTAKLNEEPHLRTLKRSMSLPQERGGGLQSNILSMTRCSLDSSQMKPKKLFKFNSIDNANISVPSIREPTKGINQTTTTETSSEEEKKEQKGDPKRSANEAVTQTLRKTAFVKSFDRQQKTSSLETDILEITLDEESEEEEEDDKNNNSDFGEKCQDSTAKTGKIEYNDQQPQLLFGEAIDLAEEAKLSNQNFSDNNFSKPTETVDILPLNFSHSMSPPQVLAATTEAVTTTTEAEATTSVTVATTTTAFSTPPRVSPLKSEECCSTTKLDCFSLETLLPLKEVNAITGELKKGSDEETDKKDDISAESTAKGQIKNIEIEVKSNETVLLTTNQIPKKQQPEQVGLNKWFEPPKIACPDQLSFCNMINLIRCRELNKNPRDFLKSRWPLRQIARAIYAGPSGTKKAMLDITKCPPPVNLKRNCDEEPLNAQAKRQCLGSRRSQFLQTIRSKNSSIHKSLPHPLTWIYCLKNIDISSPLARRILGVVPQYKISYAQMKAIRNDETHFRQFCRTNFNLKTLVLNKQHVNKYAIASDPKSQADYCHFYSFTRRQRRLREQQLDSICCSPTSTIDSKKQVQNQIVLEEGCQVHGQTNQQTG